MSSIHKKLGNILETHVISVDVDDDEFSSAGVDTGVGWRPLEGITASGVYNPHISGVRVDLHTLNVLKRTAVIYRNQAHIGRFKTSQFPGRSGVELGWTFPLIKHENSKFVPREGARV